MATKIKKKLFLSNSKTYNGKKKKNFKQESDLQHYYFHQLQHVFQPLQDHP